jgi:hypothetical protein
MWGMPVEFFLENKTILLQYSTLRLNEISLSIYVSSSSLI